MFSCRVRCPKDWFRELSAVRHTHIDRHPADRQILVQQLEKGMDRENSILIYYTHTTNTYETDRQTDRENSILIYYTHITDIQSDRWIDGQTDRKQIGNSLVLDMGEYI